MFLKNAAHKWIMLTDMKLLPTLLKSEISLHHKMTLCTLRERQTEEPRRSLMLIFCKYKKQENNHKNIDTWWKQKNDNNRDSKHPSITRRAAIITVCYTTTQILECVCRLCVFVRVQVCLSVCMCVIGEWGERPLPCTQIITWFYNVAYLYSGQFPLGGSQNNNAGHFTPPSGRPFSALILSMDLSSFPR